MGPDHTTTYKVGRPDGLSSVRRPNLDLSITTRHTFDPSDLALPQINQHDKKATDPARVRSVTASET